MSDVPQQRFPADRAEYLARSGNFLQDNVFFDTISSLVDTVSDHYAPSRIRSTFDLDEIDPMPALPLPDILARYHEVGAIKGAQIHFDATTDTHQILADIFIASNDAPRILSISSLPDSSGAYMMTENDAPLDVSPSDIEGILLSLTLPPHMRQLLEAQLVYNSGAKLDLESPQTLYILSQALRARAKKSVSVREYPLPATDSSAVSKVEVVDGGEYKSMIFSSTAFIDKPDGTDELTFDISTTHHIDLDIYDAIEVKGVEMLHNTEPVERTITDDTKRGMIEIAIQLMSDSIDTIRNDR